MGCGYRDPIFQLLLVHLGLAGPEQEAPATAAMSGIENADEMRMGNHDLRPEIN